MKFRKRPVVIEAERFTGKSLYGYPVINTRVVNGSNVKDKLQLIIPTLEGTMSADIGDWIITGINGERYPCKPDIFEKTYESV